MASFFMQAFIIVLVGDVWPYEERSYKWTSATVVDLLQVSVTECDFSLNSDMHYAPSPGIPATSTTLDETLISCENRCCDDPTCIAFHVRPVDGRDHECQTYRGGGSLASTIDYTVGSVLGYVCDIRLSLYFGGSGNSYLVNGLYRADDARKVDTRYSRIMDEMFLVGDVPGAGDWQLQDNSNVQGSVVDNANRPQDIDEQWTIGEVPQPDFTAECYQCDIIISSSHVDASNFVGLYRYEANSLHNERPLYRLNRRNQDWLFFEGPPHSWMIGPDRTVATAVARASSIAWQPELITEGWEIGGTNDPTMSAQCRFTVDPAMYMDFASAKDECESQQRSVTTIANDAENDFLFSLCPMCWVGLSDLDNDGQYTWADGSLLAFDKRTGIWTQGKCAVFHAYVSTDWIEVPCNASKRFVCELGIPGPTPATTTTPTLTPTARPSPTLTIQPSVTPTARPSLTPTTLPSLTPTTPPSLTPTTLPSLTPTNEPTAPTQLPTALPIASPTPIHTSLPTLNPTIIPSSEPSSATTLTPTLNPTNVPTHTPIPISIFDPSSVPTQIPTFDPSSVPTQIPTLTPSALGPVVGNYNGVFTSCIHEDGVGRTMDVDPGHGEPVSNCSFDDVTVSVEILGESPLLGEDVFPVSVWIDIKVDNDTVMFDGNESITFRIPYDPIEPGTTLRSSCSKNILLKSDDGDGKPNLSCEYYDRETGTTSTDGCEITDKVVELPDGRVAAQCTCYHLTAFAILQRATTEQCAYKDVLGNPIWLAFTILYMFLFIFSVFQIRNISKSSKFRWTVPMSEHILIGLIAGCHVTISIIMYSSSMIDTPLPVLALIWATTYCMTFCAYSLLIVSWARIIRNSKAMVRHASEKKFRITSLVLNLIVSTTIVVMFIGAAVTTGKVRENLVIVGSCTVAAICAITALSFLFYGIRLVWTLRRASRSIQRSDKGTSSLYKKLATTLYLALDLLSLYSIFYLFFDVILKHARMSRSSDLHFSSSDGRLVDSNQTRSQGTSGATVSEMMPRYSRNHSAVLR